MLVSAAQVAIREPSPTQKNPAPSPLRQQFQHPWCRGFPFNIKHYAVLLRQNQRETLEMPAKQNQLTHTRASNMTKAPRNT